MRDSSFIVRSLNWLNFNVVTSQGIGRSEKRGEMGGQLLGEAVRTYKYID